jgi:hypothetical protein
LKCFCTTQAYTFVFKCFVNCTIFSPGSIPLPPQVLKYTAWLWCLVFLGFYLFEWGIHIKTTQQKVPENFGLIFNIQSVLCGRRTRLTATCSLSVSTRSCPPSASNRIPSGLTAAWRPRPSSASNRIPPGLTAAWHSAEALAIGTIVGLTATCQNRPNSPSADNLVPFGLTAARPSQHSANNRVPLGLTVSGRSDPPSASNRISSGLTAAWRPRPPLLAIGSHLG